MDFDWATVASVAAVLLAGLTILNRRIDRRFDAVDRRFESFDRRFESFDRRFESFDRKFEYFDNKFDRRFEVVGQEIQALAQAVGNLRQDVGRLQGLIERTYEPERFARTPVQVRERRPAYGDEPPEAGASAKDPAES